MIREDIDLETLKDILNEVPNGTPWFYVLYAYIISVMEKNSGNRTQTSKDINMPIRSLRFKFPAMEVLGFEIPKYELVKKGCKRPSTW